MGTDQIGRFDITVDDDTNAIVDWKWQLVPINSEMAEPDAQLQAYIESFKTTVDRKYNTIICRFSEALTHPKREVETALGNLVADALAENAGADLVLLGSGFIRHTELGPVVTLGTFTACFPFQEALSRCTLTGEQLKRAFATFMRPENRHRRGRVLPGEPGRARGLQRCRAPAGVAGPWTASRWSTSGTYTHGLARIPLPQRRALPGRDGRGAGGHQAAQAGGHLHPRRAGGVPAVAPEPQQPGGRQTQLRVTPDQKGREGQGSMATQASCTRCGAALPPNARFCGACRQPVAQVAPGYGPEELPPPAVDYPAPRQRSRGLPSTGCAFGCLAAGILLLVAAAAILYAAATNGGSVTFNWPPVTATPPATATPAATPTVAVIPTAKPAPTPTVAGPEGTYGAVAFGSGWDGAAKTLTGKAAAFDQGITTLCAAFPYKGTAPGMYYHWDVYLNGRVFFGEDRVFDAGGEGIASPCVLRGDKAALSPGIYTLVVKVEGMEVLRAGTTIRAKP